MHPDGQLSYDAVADALAECGWGVFTGALSPELVSALAEHARSLETYRTAGVGRNGDAQLNRFVRRDRIAWIDGSDPVGAQWLCWTDGLRRHLNRSLMLGLRSFESHFAHYAPGTFYRRHLDAFRGEANRVVSLVCYLNETWLPADGGELVLYDEAGQNLGRFPPTMGTLAVYLSERFPHEVLPTRSDRYSLAGWFRCRAALPLANV
ncbi:MAG TPA: 2OG-Fe(II) oxygenase [Pseudomonadales bacterium]